MKATDRKGYDKIYNSIGLVPNLGVGSKGTASSTTQSAIADGILTVDGKEIDTKSINTNTENTLHQLDTIFDKKKIEERQELARLFSKNAFEQLHNWQPTTKDGKVAKSIAHGIIGELAARMTGNAPGSAFKATMTNEMLMDQIKHISENNPALAQWLSAAVGGVVNKVSNDSINVGATMASYATKWNAYGAMLKPKELDEFSYYYIIDLYGNVYKRTYNGDELISPSEVRNNSVITVVKQNPVKGYQSEGQEILVYPDGSYVNIDAPMGKVHVNSSGLLANATSSWANSSIDHPTVISDIPRVIDEWPEKSTGKIYRIYSNSSEPVFIGEYQGNRNLKSGATAIYNSDQKAWYAGGYVIYQNGVTDAIIRKQQRDKGYQIAKDQFNDPNTAVSLMGDIVSYTAEQAGYSGAGNAVTIGQTIPKLIQNQNNYDTFSGKYLAGVSDFTNEIAKARIAAATVVLATRAIASPGVNDKNPSLSFTKGLIVTGSVGLGVNNTIGIYTDEATELVKKYIKENEEHIREKETEWKNKW